MPEYPFAVSLVIITKNEEDNILRCIESASFVDEVLVIDSGSTDQTLSLAEQAGARIIQTTDWPGFGRQKGFAVEQATNDWVLCLDADEWLSDELQASIMGELADPRFNVYALPRKNHFMNRWLNHGQGYPEWIIRLFNRRHATWTQHRVHEGVVTTESVGRLSGPLYHHNVASLGDLIAKHNKYSEMQVAEIGHGLGLLYLKCVTSPISRFIRLYFLRMGFLDGFPGFAHAMLDAFAAYMKYAKAIERQYKDS